MYATEYDLLVAEHRLADRRNEMKAIRIAQTVQATTTERAGLLDRLLALTTRGAQIRAPHSNVGAAA